jgi:Plasmid pRiA4b ORF-3-like protein
VFCANDIEWGIPELDWDGGPLDARKASLADVLKDAGTKTLQYLYDFGAGWGHTIEIERLINPLPGMAYPRLIKAVGRRPPDAVGSPSFYNGLLEDICDPDRKAQVQALAKERLGEDYDPNHVDADRLGEQVAILARRWSRKETPKLPRLSDLQRSLRVPWRGSDPFSFLMRASLSEEFSDYWSTERITILERGRLLACERLPVDDEVDRLRGSGSKWAAPDNLFYWASILPYVYVRDLLHHAVGIAMSRGPKNGNKWWAKFSKILEKLRVARSAVYTCLGLVEGSDFPSGECGLPWEKLTGRWLNSLMLIWRWLHHCQRWILSLRALRPISLASTFPPVVQRMNGRPCSWRPLRLGGNN